MGKKEFTKLLTPEGEDRLRVRIVIEKSKVTDTVKGDKIKQPIAISNLNDALTYAEQDLKDRWEWYKEQYKRGIKK